MQSVKFSAEVNEVGVFTNVATVNNTYSLHMQLISWTQKIELMQNKNTLVMGHAMAYIAAVTTTTCNPSKQI
jgi:hypothetical protein